MLDRRPVAFECPCSRARAGTSLALLGEAELAAMILDDGKAEVTCNFCRARYEFDEAELEIIRREQSKPTGPPADDRDIRVLLGRAFRAPMPGATWDLPRGTFVAKPGGRWASGDRRWTGAVCVPSSASHLAQHPRDVGRRDARLLSKADHVRRIHRGRSNRAGLRRLPGALGSAEPAGGLLVRAPAGDDLVLAGWCRARPASPPGTGPSHAGFRPASAVASTRWPSPFPSVSPSSSSACTSAGSCTCSGPCSRSPGQRSS